MGLQIFRYNYHLVDFPGEEVALSDDYFIERNLYPNVDFYSGIIYRAIGIPSNMFTVMFALGRLPGWIAHWKEMWDDPNWRIGRPRQIYTGPSSRSFVKMEDRTCDSSFCTIEEKEPEVHCPVCKQDIRK